MRATPGSAPESGTKRRAGPSSTCSKGACACGSVVLAKIHPCVKTRDLISVAVELDRLPLEKLPEPPLGALAPARMVYFGINVRVKAILAGRCKIPRDRKSTRLNSS